MGQLSEIRDSLSVTSESIDVYIQRKMQNNKNEQSKCQKIKYNNEL